VKLLPSDDNFGAVVFALQFEPDIAIESFCQFLFVMVPVRFFIVAEIPVNFSVPKFASGKITPEKGASTIHSAD